MKILILDHYYPAFIDSIYRSAPGLSDRSFDEQGSRIDAGLFGETQFQVAALRRLGHEALHLPINVPNLVAAWGRDRDVQLPMYDRAVSGWRGWYPWSGRRQRGRWLASTLRAIVTTFEPDVVQVQCMDALPGEVITQLAAPGRYLVGQTAAPTPPWTQARLFDLILSSLPNFVERFRREGAIAFNIPLAFDPAVHAAVGPVERDVPASFVGTMSDAHRRRLDTLGALGRTSAVDIWSADARPDWLSAHPRVRDHGPAWGRDMYRVLARSRLTVNVHGEHAEGYANNLRLYEATGMGALLVTEEARNLQELFEPGSEVITYRDASELTRVVRHFEAHPEEASQIAAAGQARTHRDHTWLLRMERWTEIVEAARQGRMRHAASPSR